MTDARDKLKKANDEVHEAFQEVMLMEDLDIEKKANAGGHMAHIFEVFKVVHKILNAPKPTEPEA